MHEVFRLRPSVPRLAAGRICPHDRVDGAVSRQAHHLRLSHQTARRRSAILASPRGRVRCVRTNARTPRARSRMA
jgi:hypothetical protein